MWATAPAPGASGLGVAVLVVTFTCPYVTIRLDMCRVMIPELILRQVADLLVRPVVRLDPNLRV